jgi:uncharacterized protein (DUF362 family)/Pyruvate/2-oxoacid:ferredoxin oxidoreductase delta subunit
MDQVALVRCPEYELERVKAALRQGLDLLGGLASFVGQGERVLVKVNCLMPAAPERAVTTHPVFLRAVLQLLRERTGQLVVADSPGYWPFLSAARSIGYEAVAKEEGAELAEFHEDEEVENPQGLLYKRFKVSALLRQVDRIINLPKLKTHGLMYLTGSVKNMFGVIPGLRKTTYHLKAGQDKWLFAKMLVDLYLACPPTLNLMDGIVGMEGNGPANGQPVKLGVILLGANGFAVDEVMARVANIAPGRVYTNAVYRKYILGGKEPEIELLGAPLAEAVKADFQPIHDTRSVIPEWAFNLGKNLISPRQVYLKEKCIGCMICVKSCPAGALHHEEGKGILCDYHACIRCFICQEMCPVGAIELRRGLLARLIR